MGWLASLFQDGCDYARLSGDIVAKIAGQPDAPWLEVGFAAYREPEVTPEGEWRVVYEGRCLEYPADIVEIDTKWKVAKGFAFFALVLGGGGTFFLWFNTCCVFSRGTWRWAGYEILFASIFNAISFLWFRTSMCQDGNNKCDLFWGSKTDIVASVFWFLAAVCIFCYYPKPVENMGRGGDGLFVDGDQQQQHGNNNNNMTASDGLDDDDDDDDNAMGAAEDSDFARSPQERLMNDGDDDTGAFATIELQSKSFQEESQIMQSGENSRQDGSAGRRRSKGDDDDDSRIV